LFVGDLDGLPKVVGSLYGVKPVVDENVLTLNETQVIDDEFQKFLLPELDLILSHLEILTDGPQKLRGVLQPNYNLAYRTIGRSQLLSL
jgi:hypothetical protein